MCKRLILEGMSQLFYVYAYEVLNSVSASKIGYSNNIQTVLDGSPATRNIHCVSKTTHL